MITRAKLNNIFNAVCIKVILIAALSSVLMISCSKKQKGVTIKLPFPDLPSLNPIYWQAQHILAQGTIYEGLFTYSPDPNGIGGLKIVPEIASSYKISPDGKRWIIKLRKNKKWSNGDPVTARDFEWSFQLYASTVFPDIPYWASPLRLLENAWAVKSGSLDPKELGVKALDDWTLEFKCLKAEYNLHAWLCVGGAVPIHRPTYEAHKDDWWKPENFVGNGPYIVKEWIQGEKTVLVKNTNYVGKTGNVETIILKVIQPGPGLGIQAYQTGELDMIFLWTVGDLKYVKNNPKLVEQLHETPGDLMWRGYQISRGFSPVFDDIRVRKAFAMSFNRETFVEKVLGGRAYPAYKYWSDESVIGKKMKPIKFDPEAAKKLLAEAGYPEGKGLPKLKFFTISTPAELRFAEYIVAQWKQNLGVDVMVDNVEAGLYWSKYVWGTGLPEIGPGFTLMSSPMNSVNPEALLKNSCHSFWFFGFPSEIRKKRYELDVGKRQEIQQSEKGADQADWDALIASKKEMLTLFNKIVAEEPDKYWKEDMLLAPVWHTQFDNVVKKYKQAKANKEKNTLWKNAAEILRAQEIFHVEYMGMTDANKKGRRMHNKLARTPFHKTVKTAHKDCQQTLDQYYMVPMNFDKYQYLINPRLKNAIIYKFSWGPQVFNFKYLEYETE